MARLKRIHVNKHHIAHNRKHDRSCWRPVFTVKEHGSPNRKGNSVEVSDGSVRLVYRPEKPLSCGAVAWVETYGEVEVT